PRASPGAPMFMTILASGKRSTAVPVPALVIYALPHVPEPGITGSTDPALREAGLAFFAAVDALTERQVAAWQAAMPAARVVRLRSTHFVFRSHEQDVLREM